MAEWTNSHQAANAKDSSLSKGKVFSSIELTPSKVGFSSSWLQGNVDFTQGIFDLTMQRISPTINLEPSLNYIFAQGNL